MSNGKSKKNRRERETIAMRTFSAANSAAERFALSTDPDLLFEDVAEQVAAVIKAFGVPVNDPEHLYHEIRIEHRDEWPEYITVAVEAFYSLHQARRNIEENDAKWAVYHMISAIKHISLYNLLAFEDQIVLGDNLIVAQREGGKASGATRRESSAEKAAHVIAAARKLLADGKSQRDLVGILKQRFDHGETFIRETLKKAGLVKGRASKPIG